MIVIRGDGHLVICAVLLLGMFGCARQPPVRVGAKDFAEQQLLGEMAVLLLDARGIRVAPVVTCKDTFTAQRMLRTGQVDLMAEYSGTRWLFDVGPVPPETSNLLAAVRRRDARIGLVWLDRLGFENPYCVIVTTERAEALGLETIGDLRRLERPVRVACPPEYLRRPLDGLSALAEAYDLNLHDSPFVNPDINARVQALLNGRVDAVICDLTDGVINRFGLRILEDDQDFFPPYDAAFVVRSEVVENRPEVVEALRQLEGRLTVETMRDLVFEVDVEGRLPARVAQNFLLEQDPPLIRPAPERLRQQPRILVARAEGDDLGSLDDQALLAVHEAFPGREVNEKLVDRPDAEVTQGEARLALIGAERFFRFRGGGPLRRIESIEAAAVVGNRFVHLIRRDDAADPFGGAVGVPPEGSGAGRVARRLLEDRVPARSASVASLLDALVGGQLDAAVLLAEEGDPRIARAMAESEGRLRLVPIQDWLTPERAARNPFLRAGRLDEGVYGLSEPVETLSTQVVLAGASSEGVTMAAGPGAALPLGGIPLRPEEVEALAAAVPVPVAPDPALPSAWGVSEPRPEPSLFESAWMTLMNLLALAFLGWLVAVVRAPAPAPEAEEVGETTGIPSSDGNS